VKLLSVDIRSLPGIDAPFVVDLAPDTANLITGPNGSGKSSLVRAVRAVLHPERVPDYCEVLVRWQSDQGEWLAHRLGDQVTWTRNGQKTAPPRLPESASIDAFLISTEDLAALGQTDELIAAELKTLLTGGYDLDGILAQATLSLPPRPQKLARDIDQLHHAIDEKEREYSDLHHEVDQLTALETQLEQATQASRRISAVEAAQALTAATARRSALETTLIEEFPGGMDRLRGDELERLDDLKQQLERKQQAIVLEHTALKQEQSRLDDTGVKDLEALETLQAELSDARDRLAGHEQRIDTETAQLKQSEQALSEAATRLGSEQPEQLNALDQSALEQLEKQVEKVLGLRERIRAISGQLGLSQASRNLTGRPRDDLRTARAALQDWLGLARLNPLEGWLWGILSIAALIGGVRLIGGTDLSEQPELLLLTALAIGLPIAMVVRFALRWRDRSDARRIFEQSQIEPPLGWSESEVRARLRRLDLELEAATQHEISQLRAGDLRADLNAQRSALDRARQQLTELASSMGLSAEQRLETSFLLWSRYLHDWQQNCEAVEQRKRRIRELTADYEAECRHARDLMAQHGVDSEVISSREVSALVNQLTPKMRRFAELFNSVQSRNRRIGELHADISQLRHRIQAIFEAAGMRPDDESGLRLKVEQLALWRQLEQERVELSREITQLEQTLSDEPELLSLATKQRQHELKPLHAQLMERSEQRDSLNRRIAEIQTRYSDAFERRELQQLGIELDHARNALKLELERHLLAAAGRFLIEDVASAHRDEQEPALLASADRWLNRFTGHRYRLEFDGGQFQATDSRSGQRQTARELSTGTRAQLMLALRLAWIEQIESQFESIPLFMDEALTTSDADRYRAIVQASGELIAAGRQVFYITAQSDDAQAWRKWLGHGLRPNEVDMAEVRQGQVRQLEFQMPESPAQTLELPDPSDYAPEEWAQAAGIAAINPWQSAGTISVFHLLHDELKLVATLIGSGLASLGALERLLDLIDTSPDSAPAWLETASSAQLRGRIAAGRMVLDHWRAGHRRPVDPAALARSELLSERFLPRVIKLNDELGGDPDKLIEALRSGQVPRFRSDTLDQLMAWLTDNGFLKSADGHAPLSAAEVAVASGLSAELAEKISHWIEGAIHDPFRQGTTSKT
jgi:DNA repair exonuclease SbcCD ATPase subunit